MMSCKTFRGALCLIGLLLITTSAFADEPFRPEAGTFPPLEQAKSVQGELVFVDHASRRGSIRLPSEGKLWKLKEVAIGEDQGMIVASRESKASRESNASAAGKENELELTIDAATRIWRGHGRLGLEDLVADGVWPATGKKSLDGQAVLLGLRWKPTPGTRHTRLSVFNRYHISDVWLDETAMQRATKQQTEEHKSLIRSRWMPAWVDAVEYGKFGEATVTATLFGGMDPALYADFKKSSQGQMAVSNPFLKQSLTPSSIAR